MAPRIALFTLPAAATAALVVLLNSLDASAGIAVVSFGAVAVVSGATLGYVADGLPGS